MEASRPLAKTRRGPYGVYHYAVDSRTKVPRTTRWRNEKQNIVSDSDNHVNDNEELGLEQETRNRMDIDEPDGGPFADCLSEQSPDMVVTSNNSYASADKEMDATSIELEGGAETQDYYADDVDVLSDHEEVHVNSSETSSNSSDIEDQLLYDGARLTVGTSMLLIATFAIRHGLTGEAIFDLLTLVELHCLAGNLCRSTERLYKDFFLRIKMPVQRHFFCKMCSHYGGTTSFDKCPLCEHGTCDYFIVVPVASQLQTLLKDVSLRRLIKEHKLRRNKGDGNLSDVQDGKLYKEHFDDDGFYHGTFPRMKQELHLSLQLNTDGVSIFRSSTFGLWPVYAVINELPPNARYTKENRLFLGLWFGQSKPNMNLFLKPLVDELKDLYFNGLNIDGTLCRVLILSLVADAPARCLLANLIQFNGKHGCPCCLHPGERFQTSNSGFSRIFPFSTDTESGHLDSRTHKDTLTLGKEVDEEYYNSNRDLSVPKFGVKGSTVLSFLPGFDIIRGNTIDCMHCVYLGITKMMVNLWISVNYRNEKWSLRKQLQTLNLRLGQVKPPNFVTRMPRSLDDLCHWKASEYRSFLLYYSLPIMHDLMDPRYFQHWMLFVSAIFILSSRSISSNDLAKACNNLKQFCLQTEVLYTKRCCTFNLHCLLHLVEKVKDHGPLWAHSCFYYESFNGDLRRMFHGTQNVQMQVMHAVCVQQKLPELSKLLKFGSEAESFYQKLTRKTNRNDVKINEGFIVGGIKQCVFPADVKIACAPLSNLMEKGCEHQVFYKFRKDGCTIHSSDYQQDKRRNSFTVSYQKAGLCVYGHVKCYLRSLSVTGIVQHFALIRQLRVCDLPRNPLNAYPFAKIVVDSGQYELVKLSEIEALCVYIEIPSNKVAYIFRCPNFLESD